MKHFPRFVSNFGFGTRGAVIAMVTLLAVGAGLAQAHFIRQTGPSGWGYGYGYGYGPGYGVYNGSYRIVGLGDPPAPVYAYGYGYGLKSSRRSGSGEPTVYSRTPTPTPEPESEEPGLPPLPGEHGLEEGDLIRARGDVDIFVLNPWGFKRLFLNEAIFLLYGHLGGFPAVQEVTPEVRDAFLTSIYVTNCDLPAADRPVYGLEATGDDTGVLHHIQLTGEQAVAQDPFFFLKVFCINTGEYNFFLPLGAPWTSLP